MKTLTTQTAMILMLVFSLAGCSHPSDGRSSTATEAVAASTDDSGQQIREAIVHAREAEKFGMKGDAQDLVVHAEAALNFVNQSQKSGPTREHLRQANEALGQAIEEGRKGDAKVAAQRVRDALVELLQAEDVQDSSKRQPATGNGRSASEGRGF